VVKAVGLTKEKLSLLETKSGEGGWIDKENVRFFWWDGWKELVCLFYLGSR
jgi:hypothetical protein